MINAIVAILIIIIGLAIGAILKMIFDRGGR